MEKARFLFAGCAVAPEEVVLGLCRAGEAKALQPLGTLLIRGALSGALLAAATTVAFTATVQTGVPLVGALVFPVGFVMLVLLGLELLTGNFLLLPLAVVGGNASPVQLMRNWAAVFAGNLVGSLLYAALYVGLGAGQEPVQELLVRVAEAKTIGYAGEGVRGLGTMLARAVLCNWLVTLGVVMSMVSRSVPGKVVAMWLPIFAFFSQGFEHSVVNMFVIPAGMMAGAQVTTLDWWMWNQIPVTLGNLIGALTLTAMPVVWGRMR